MFLQVRIQTYRKNSSNNLSEKIISLRAEPAADMGGSGGGGVLITEGGGVLKIAEPNTRITASEIVFKISENQGRVRFAYGQLFEGKWEISRIRDARK
jgi:hypothetical protein